MKSLTVRLPESVIGEIERESRTRGLSKSDVVRERLVRGAAERSQRSRSFDAIADLIGAAEGLPSDLGTRKKHYLKVTGYGRKRHR